MNAEEGMGTYVDQDEVCSNSQTKGPDVFSPKHCNQDESKPVACRSPGNQSIARGDLNCIPYKPNNTEFGLVCLLHLGTREKRWVSMVDGGW